MLDVIALVTRLIAYVQSVRSGEQPFALKSCWNAVVLDREHRPIGLGGEYTGLVSDEPEELEVAELKAREIEGGASGSRDLPPIELAMSPVLEDDAGSEEWSNDVRRHQHSRYPQSAGSERTMFEPHSPRGSIHSDETVHNEEFSPLNWLRNASRAAILRKIGHACFATLEPSLVFMGLMQVLTGIVIYTGGCRQNWINGCLAHLISECRLSFICPGAS